MSAGMAEVIAAHNGYDTHWESRDGDQIWYTVCDGCDWRQNLENAPADDHAAHVAEELHKAGYGLLPDVAQDADKRERAQDVILAFNGTPRHRLFGYPYRDDDSRLLIAGADTAVSGVLEALFSTEPTP